MRILAIDFGERKIGLAFAETIIAEPYSVLRYSSKDLVIKKILEIINKLKVEKVILGLSEGQSAVNTKKFGEKLANNNIDFEYVDETLTTKEAQKYSIEANVKKLKRRQMEDAYAATVMLQWFIEKNV